MLPANIKLKGKDNYRVQKEQIKNIAAGIGLKRYLQKDAPVPKEVDEFDNNKSDLQKKKWLQYKARNARMINSIIQNCTPTCQSVITGKKTAVAIIEALEVQYAGSTTIMEYQALMEFVYISYNSTKDLGAFVVLYRRSVELLATLINKDKAILKKWPAMFFIQALANTFPIWSKRQRSAIREAKKPTLDKLIADVSNKARQKEMTLNGTSLYSNKSCNLLEKDKKKGKGKHNNKGDSNKNKKKKCPGCGHPAPKHSPSKCLQTNKELRKK